MAQVSLIATAAQLGKTAGQILLSALRTNGYTRTFAGSGYLRVNPFEVDANRAQDPDEAGTQHRLGDWLNYDHDRVGEGDNLLPTSGYGEIEVSFSRPNGYTRAPAILDQRLFIKDTGDTEIDEGTTAVNPFSSPDGQASIGDGTTGDIDGSFAEGNYVAVGVKAEFDDSVSTFTNTDSLAYDAHASAQELTGAGRGVLVKVFAANPGPVSAVQTTDPDSCIGGDPVNIQISCNMEGPSTGTLQRSTNGGAFSTVDSNVSAGSSTINRSETSGNNYQYRLRYNDVSPDQWATQVGNVSAVCNLT
jgi:hypothetical protein